MAIKRLQNRSGIVTVTGYGIGITIERGHLCVHDGVGTERRLVRFSRIDGIKRLVVLGHSGIISFDALRWLHDVGAAFVHIDVDGELIAADNPPRYSDARLRRAQALAFGNGVSLAIAKDLIRQKLNAQADLLWQLPNTVNAMWTIRGLARETEKARTVEELRYLEAQAARTYWDAWREVPIRFAKPDGARVPEHWRTFGSRVSGISSPSARRATNPANAMLNYCYAVLESEARIAALSLGLDPSIGVMHFDQQARDSLACDIMEPVRPLIDAFVLQMVQTREFQKVDFFETREGICRVMPPLSQRLAETADRWAKVVASVAEGVAKVLHKRYSSETLPTPLTERNRSAGRLLTR